jgi:hypothetical protein
VTRSINEFSFPIVHILFIFHWISQTTEPIALQKVQTVNALYKVLSTIIKLVESDCGRLSKCQSKMTKQQENDMGRKQRSEDSNLGAFTAPTRTDMASSKCSDTGAQRIQLS